MSLADLRVLLDDLDESHPGTWTPVERARQARLLSDVAMRELSAYGDEQVYVATRFASRADVAAALGVSVAAVAKAVYRRNKALAVRTESDTPKRARRAKGT